MDEAEHGEITLQEIIAFYVKAAAQQDAARLEAECREALALHDGSPLALTVVDHRPDRLASPRRAVASLWPQRLGETP